MAEAEVGDVMIIKLDVWNRVQNAIFPCGRVEVATSSVPLSHQSCC